MNLLHLGDKQEGRDGNDCYGRYGDPVWKTVTNKQ
jgi:hypothetical protein